MQWTSRGPGKWWWWLIGSIMLLLALFTLSKSHHLEETNITIQATPDQVWSVLSDLQAYPEWNPFITQASGELKEGGTIKVTISPPGGKPTDFEPVLKSVQPGKELRWLGHLGPPRVFDGAHYFVIDTTDQARGTVKFVQGEDFTGILVPFLAKSLQTKVRSGYEQMNEALKKRVEEKYQQLLPGSQVDFLTAPEGGIVFRLQPTIIQGGAATDEGEYNSSIAYFTAPADDEATLSALGDLLIEAGFNLEMVDSSKPEQTTEYFANADGGTEVHLGRFHVSQQLADMMAGVGKPVFPSGMPADFVKDGAYSGFRIELREFTPDETTVKPENAEEAPPADNGIEGLNEGLTPEHQPPADFDPGTST